MTVVVDASGLIAAVDRGSSSHRATNQLLDELRANNARFVISPFILAEADYLLSESKSRPDIALQVLRDVARDSYHLEPFGPEDLDRAADVIESYPDQSIGLADASNVVLSERYNTPDILTLDERHFRVLQAAGGKLFRLLPKDR